MWGSNVATGNFVSCSNTPIPSGKATAIEVTMATSSVTRCQRPLSNRVPQRVFSSSCKLTGGSSRLKLAMTVHYSK